MNSSDFESSKIKKLTRRYNTHKTKGIRRLLQDAKADLQVVYKKLEEQRMNGQIGEIGNAIIARDTGKAWKIVNTITIRKATPSGKHSE